MIGTKTEMELRRYTLVEDGMGGASVFYQGVRKLSGVLSSISGDEKLSQDRTTVIQTHNFYTDYIAGITEKDKLVFGARSFDIRCVENIGANQNKALKITLKELT